MTNHRILSRLYLVLLLFGLTHCFEPPVSNNLGNLEFVKQGKQKLQVLINLDTALANEKFAFVKEVQNTGVGGLELFINCPTVEDTEAGLVTYKKTYSGDLEVVDGVYLETGFDISAEEIATQIKNQEEFGGKAACIVAIQVNDDNIAKLQRCFDEKESGAGYIYKLDEAYIKSYESEAGNNKIEFLLQPGDGFEFSKMLTSNSRCDGSENPDNKVLYTFQSDKNGDTRYFIRQGNLLMLGAEANKLRLKVKTVGKNSQQVETYNLMDANRNDCLTAQNNNTDVLIYGFTTCASGNVEQVFEFDKNKDKDQLKQNITQKGLVKQFCVGQDRSSDTQMIEAPRSQPCSEVGLTHFNITTE